MLYLFAITIFMFRKFATTINTKRRLKMKETITIPQFMTIREVAKTGLLPQNCLRTMAKNGTLPCIYTGNRCLVNYSLLIEQLNDLGGIS